jgi:hypothetical protein
MNSASFYTEVEVLKPNANYKNRFVGIDEPFFCLFDIILVGWMK